MEVIDPGDPVLLADQRQFTERLETEWLWTFALERGNDVARHQRPFTGRILCGRRVSTLAARVRNLGAIAQGPDARVVRHGARCVYDDASVVPAPAVNRLNYRAGFHAASPDQQVSRNPAVTLQVDVTFAGTSDFKMLGVLCSLVGQRPLTLR